MPPQFDFVFRKWGEEIKADPSLAAAAVQGDHREGPGVLRGFATQDQRWSGRFEGVRPLMGWHDP